MEDKAHVNNADMFNVFEDIRNMMDDYYVKMVGAEVDSDSHVHYHVRQHVTVMMESSAEFFLNEEAFQNLTGEIFYSFKSILELFRQYMSYMRTVFIQQSAIDSTLEGEDVEGLNEIFDTINQTFIVIVMEKLLALIFDTVETIKDGILLDLAEADLRSEAKTVNDAEFDSIMQANMWEFDMGNIMPEGKHDDEQ